MLEKTEGVIKKGQSRETGNKTKKKKKTQKHNTLCVGHQYTQTSTNIVNKTWALQLSYDHDHDGPFYRNREYM